MNNNQEEYKITYEEKLWIKLYKMIKEEDILRKFYDMDNWNKVYKDKNWNIEIKKNNMPKSMRIDNKNRHNNGYRFNCEDIHFWTINEYNNNIKREGFILIRKGKDYSKKNNIFNYEAKYVLKIPEIMDKGVIVWKQDKESLLEDIMNYACPNGHYGGCYGCDLCPSCPEGDDYGCRMFGCRRCYKKKSFNMKEFLKENNWGKYDIMKHYNLVHNK